MSNENKYLLIKVDDVERIITDANDYNYVLGISEFESISQTITLDSSVLDKAKEYASSFATDDLKLVSKVSFTDGATSQQAKNEIELRELLEFISRDGYFADHVIDTTLTQLLQLFKQRKK